MSIRVGYQPSTYLLQGGPSHLRASFATLIQRADQAGVSAIALMDHFLPPGEVPITDPMLEGYTALGFVAAHTQSADVMLLVSGVTHRHPVMLAKAVTTLDVLTGGQARLGIGAGWFERENRTYGLPFPQLADRFGMLDETLQIVRQLWGPGDGPFHGRYYSLESTMWSPMPVRQPAPPILIGGSGRTQTLRLVARHADACNLLVGPDHGGPAHVAELLTVLQAHCAAVGRDDTTIIKTILYAAPLQLNRSGVAAFAAEMREYATLGISEVFVLGMNADQLRFVDALGSDIIPAVTAATAD